MRALATVAAVFGVLVPTTGWAQGTVAQPAALLLPRSPARIATVEPDNVVAPAVVNRISEEVDARWRSVHQRIENDPQLKYAGMLMGLGAATFGALRGQRALTFVGGHALLLGLDPQLTRVRQRSGFAVSPSVGYRTLTVVVRRTFD